MSLGLLASAWLAGALGGVHCVAMCGGLAAALGARDAAASAVLLPARRIALGQALYHVGRIGTYAILGAAIGAAGGMTLLALDAVPLQRALYVASNVLLVALGASFVVRVPAIVVMQHAGARAVAPALRALAPLLRVPGVPGRMAMGLAWGLMPCALVYGVLPLALLSGGAWQGAAVMLAFGIGTAPNLLAGGILMSRARRVLSAQAVRRTAAIITIGFGFVGLARAWIVPVPLAPFCLT